MGNCQCLNYIISSQKVIHLSDLNKIDNQNKTNNSTTIPSIHSIDNLFEKKVLKEINFVRTNPKEYANKMKGLTKNILKENNEYFYQNKNNLSEKKIVLKSGSKIFFETIDYLEKLEPINELIWNDELRIEYQNDNIILTKENLGKIILNKRLEFLKNYENCHFNIDVFREPKLSILFQILDENFDKKRRNAILNKKFSMIAINSLKDKENNFYSICCFV